MKSAQKPLNPTKNPLSLLCLVFKSLRTTSKTIAGIEDMLIFWKGQLRRSLSAGPSRVQIVNIYKIMSLINT